MALPRQKKLSDVLPSPNTSWPIRISATAPAVKMDGSRLFSNPRVVMGVAWAQAGRDYMQDAFSLRLSCSVEKKEIDFFGVFDGHGPNGENVSRYVAYNLYDMVLSRFNKPNVTFPQAIEGGCIALDNMMRNMPELKNGEKEVLGGSTACAVWIKGGKIYSANVGDSRFILSYKGKAIAITKDHKPNYPQESDRINKAGGFVSDDNRVNGILGVARSFGDFMFKDRANLGPHQQDVSVVPDVHIVDMDENVDFLVLATDGIWDLMTNQQVIDYIVARMEKFTPLNEICKDIIQGCTLPIDPATGLGSDNMTIIIAILR